MTAEAKEKIKVLIADDHAIVRHGIERVLSKVSDIEVTGEAENGNQVFELLKSNPADILLLDIDMPGKNGWDVMKEMKSRHPKVAVIVLSMFEEESYGPRFIKAGAAGYINKKSAAENLVDAIRKVSQGTRYISQHLADILLQDLGGGPQRSVPHETLSDREFQVLCCIASGKRLKDIADDLSLSVTTVSTHRAHILEKMKMKTNAELIRYAVDNGLVK